MDAYQREMGEDDQQVPEAQEKIKVWEKLKHIRHHYITINAQAPLAIESEHWRFIRNRLIFLMCKHEILTLREAW